MPIPEAKLRPGDARQKAQKRAHYAGKTMAQLAHVVQKRGREKLLACKFILIFANTASRFSLFRGKHEPIEYLSNATRPTYAARIDIDTHHG